MTGERYSVSRLYADETDVSQVICGRVIYFHLESEMSNQSFG